MQTPKCFSKHLSPSNVQTRPGQGPLDAHAPYSLMNMPKHRCGFYVPSDFQREKANLSISDELANEFFLENRKMALHRTCTLSLGKAIGRWASTALTRVQVPEGYRAVADVETSRVGSGFPSQERSGGGEPSMVPSGSPGTAAGQEGQGEGVPSSFGPNRGGGTPYFCQGSYPIPKRRLLEVPRHPAISSASLVPCRHSDSYPSLPWKAGHCWGAQGG